MTLGGNTPGSDTFTAFSPATLATTNSINEGKPDVDNPVDIRWDTTGDLLIANSGSGGADTGNMACVPIGAIAIGYPQPDHPSPPGAEAEAAARGHAFRRVGRSG